MQMRSENIFLRTGLKWESWRLAIPGFVTIGLVFLVFMSIGCDPSGSAGQVDGRRIGEIDGVVVPALEEELVLRDWKEGAPTGDLHLQGSTVATLSDAEKEAINDSFDMGFIVALIDPSIEDILDLHDVLGKDLPFVDNGPLDLVAFSREFNVSGIRYFIMKPHESADGSPIPPDVNRDRVVALGDWAPMASSGPSLQQETPQNSLRQLADSISWTQHASQGGKVNSEAESFNVDPDFVLVFQGSTQVWSAHSIDAINNTGGQGADFYYIATMYTLTPTSTQGLTGGEPPRFNCSAVCNNPLIFQCGDQFGGVQQYFANSFQGNSISQPTIQNIIQSPQTTTGETTTTSGVTHSISGTASYSQGDGAGVGVSAGVSYSNSQSFSSPTVVTTNLANAGEGENNANWRFFIEGSRVMFAAFDPWIQWVWEANPSTRSAGSLILEQQVSYTYFPYSCWQGFVPSNLITALRAAFPVPPLPPSCTTNSDCPVGMECSSTGQCDPQPCDDNTPCPVGFECVNDICQSES
jgi:hypothetical protein